MTSQPQRSKDGFFELTGLNILSRDQTPMISLVHYKGHVTNIDHTHMVRWLEFLPEAAYVAGC